MEPAPELVTFMEHFLKSYVAFDADSLVDTIAKDSDSLFIGTDPNEWWSGFEAISAVVRVQFSEFQSFADRSWDIEEIVAMKEGTVGWIAARAWATIGAYRHLIRVTLVVHEQGAYWRVVQWHTSIPIRNEEAFGTELSTVLDEILAMVQFESPPVESVAKDGSVAIVFTDIVESTALMEALGEEQWLDLLGWHDRQVMQHTAVFGGSVVKGLGDGFMLAFPSPGAAAAAAAAIERAFTTGWSGVQVQIRIGIHGGSVIAEDGDFFGRTVVIAARLAGAAEGGEILVSQSLQEALGGAFAFAEARTLSFKGLAGKYAAFPLNWS